MDQPEEKSITSERFLNLYQKVANDENVIKIEDAPGITIVRKYNEGSEYFKDGKRMFIKLYLKDNYIVGSVDMVEKNEDNSFTVVYDEKKYKKRFTNFFFNKSENIILDVKDNKFVIKKRFKIYRFSINDFIQVLVKNHLSDLLFLRRKINILKIGFLKSIFWSIDSKYDWIEYYHKIHEEKSTPNKAGQVSIDLLNDPEPEPFFKYFKIYRKILFFTISMETIILLYYFEKINVNSYTSNHNFYKILTVDNFTISNPILLFVFFITLFCLHYFSIFLKGKIYDKNGFIYKIHNSSLNNSFSLKILWGNY